MSVLARHTNVTRPARKLAQLLTVSLVAAAGMVLPASTAHAATEYGYDISWPQCPNGQPMPPSNTSFVIIGLTRGLAFTENPCLEDHLDWALDNDIKTQAYAMATFPTTAQLNTYGGRGPWPTRDRADRLRNVGYAEGRAAVASLDRLDWDPGVVWIDVEPRATQEWPSSTAAEKLENRYVITGLMRALDEAGYGYGLYSYLNGWNEITDGWQLTGVPVWAASGTLDYPDEALDKCTSESFSGGPVYISQWTDGTYDYNLTCGRASFESFDSSQFVDFPPRTQFFDEIEWLADNGISTGWVEPEGTRTYRAWEPIARDAMAAFFYRLAGSPAYEAPATSPFTDVTTSSKFFKEMAWMHDQGIATGYDDGTYRPLDPVNRDAMAAFMYRFKGSPAFTTPTTSPFTDITPSDQFFTEIAWLYSTGVSTGWSDRTYRPVTPVMRDAMAAFMYRLSEV